MIPLGDRLRRRGLPLATATLALACALVYAALLWLSAAEQSAVITRWALAPAALAPLLAGDFAAAGQAARLFTSVLLHAGLLHLAGNLLFLWVFGRAVEAAMGHARFLAFFVLCGALAGLVHTLAQPASTLPTVGASGAISGVMGAYLALHPRARVRSLVLLVVVPVATEVPAVLWLVVWLALQLLAGARAMGARPEGGAVSVAWWAHAGGFAAGLLLHRFFLAGARSPPRAT